MTIRPNGEERFYVFSALAYTASSVAHSGETSFVFIEADKEKRLNVSKLATKFLLDWKWYHKTFHFGSFESQYNTITNATAEAT